MKNNYKNNTGYTIIETMISVSLFIIIVMAGMGALLNANLLHGKSENMRSIMDSLSFIMEDMSRNLRTGYNYHCFDDNDDVSANVSVPESGENCWGISFEHQGGTLYDDPPTNINYHDEDQWVYYINGEKIYKSTDGGGTVIQLTPDEVIIQLSDGFSVLGAEPSPGDSQQPFVTIKLVGKIIMKGVETPFSLQTSVSQRGLDI